MVNKKSWEEFRNTGLLLIINQFLHIFGWAICFDIKEDKVLEVYPSRVDYRGFHEDSVDKAYYKVTEYLNENIKELLKEAKESYFE